MKFCQHCGKELMEAAVICPHCGCAVNGANTAVNVVPQNDDVSVGLCILSALIPLFGIIYWPVCHKKTPKRAMACGITAIVSWVVYILLMSLMGL